MLNDPLALRPGRELSTLARAGEQSLGTRSERAREGGSVIASERTAPAFDQMQGQSRGGRRNTLARGSFASKSVRQKHQVSMKRITRIHERKKK